MKRHYYLSDDLDDLERLESELISAGFNEEQIHVLSDDVANADNHHLHSVNSLSRQDIIHSGFIGLIIGLSLVVVILGATYLFKLHITAAGWLPIVILSVITLGFCTWEGGLWGIQKPNHEFERFKSEIGKGRHLFFIDADKSQEKKLRNIIDHHKRLESSVTGSATPKWIVDARHQWHKFIHWAP